MLMHAAKEDAVKIHDNSNMVMHMPAEVGNVEEGLKESVKVYQGSYSTQIVQHVPMEKNGLYMLLG